MRILDSSKYTVNIPLIKSMLIDKTDQERLESVGPLAIITGVPIIIVTEYIRQLFGDIPGLSDKKQRLMVFYQIDEVI